MNINVNNYVVKQAQVTYFGGLPRSLHVPCTTGTEQMVSSSPQTPWRDRKYFIALQVYLTEEIEPFL